MNRRKSMLSDHFEKLKELIPEVYSHPSLQEESSENNPLFKVVKRTLSIIEALYLQNNEALRPATIDEYAQIIHDLKNMGYNYNGNTDLLDKAAGQLIMKAKKPMKKAQGKSRKSDQDDHKQAM